MLKAADFQQALSLRPCAKTAHFAVHHVPASFRSIRRLKRPQGELSTGGAPFGGAPVDDLAGMSSEVVRLPQLAELGMVVPKRNAPRAVTRNLVKRHIRAAFASVSQRGGISSGAWVIRLRSPFDKQRWMSAQSDLLADMVREELRELLQRACGEASTAGARS